MKVSRATIVALAIASLAACNRGEDAAPSSTKSAAGTLASPPKPVQEALTGSPRPALLLTQAWFWTDANGKPNPGPARLDIFRKNDSGTWERTRLEDGDSNVFHKALPFGGGILTIGAEGANAKVWKHANGSWSAETLWTRKWSGRFNRLRDVEIGDVDQDGKDELVIATHDSGVVAVIDPAEGGGKPTVTELDEKPDTFVHEIEIADVDGDGRLEFFATPSDRNTATHSQAGGVVMYKFDGQKYVRTWVEHQEGTHAKEILARDLDGDGKAELFSVLEAEVDPAEKKKIKKPVEVRQYHLQPDGTFTHESIATIQDRQTRFLVPGDFDRDGKMELVAAALGTGVYYLTPPDGGQGPWTVTLIDAESSGFEHAAYAADLEGDGSLELYVAADDQHELRRYTFKPGDGGRPGTFTREVIGEIEPSTLTWNITTGTL
jgi:hypothetical protein